MKIRPSVAVFDTCLFFALLAAALVLDWGGGVLHIGGLRISAQRGWKPIAWVVVALTLRVRWYGRIGPFGRTWREVWRASGGKEDLQHTRPGPIPGWRESLAALAGLIGALAIVFHEQVADLYRVPDLGDPLFSMWRMAWVPHQLATDPWHLFDANIFYPDRATLTYSDSMILPALTAAPLLWAGVHPVVAYNLLFLSGFVASGLAAYVLGRAIGFGRIGAWTAALIFCLYPFRLEHYSHLELQMVQWAPLALLAVHRLMSTGRFRYAVYLAAGIAAQWYSSMYYGLFLMAYAAVFAGVLVIAWRPGRRPAAYAAAGLMLGAACVVPLARAYTAGESGRGTRPMSAIREFSAHPTEYLQPTRRSALYAWIPIGERNVERDLFPGLAPLALSAAAIAPPLTATRLAILVAGLVAFDGSLGLHGHWYPIAYRLIPQLKSVRVPARFAVFVGLSLALLAGSGVDRLSRRISSAGVRGASLAALTVFLLVEAWPVLGLVPVWRQPPSIYGSLGPRGGAVLYEYPMRADPDWFGENIPYMYFSIWHWTKMVNGYSGFLPLSYRRLAAGTEGFPLGSSVDYLQQIGVTHVTVHCGLWEAKACAQVIGQLDSDARFTLVATTQWRGAPARLYALRP